ncbi:hypothetical protein SNE40_011847 [Patella caerulea]|uniref:Uncharacterized protein n=1 Tax=Patella caerulea TaxID=87958 RepID=A0AAN8JMA2_PATCE
MIVLTLVAVEARYHYSCYKDFTRPRRERKQGSSNRPTDEAKNEYFAMLCQWLDKDGDAEIFSVDELWEKMCDLAATIDVYSKKWLKSLLKERYGEHIFFANIGGSRKEAVCFRIMASYIVNEQWYSERSGDSVTEKKRIMTAAAKLVREEIRERNYNKDKYPDDGAIRDFSKMSDFIVPSLKIFLDVLLNRELWKVALGQALIQSVIAPLLFGLGVELDHIFVSNRVVSQLYSLGVCISADEVALFKNSILQDEEQYSLSTSEEIDSQVMDTETPCYQFVADKADANIVTLDGTGTFHSTGLIRWIKRGMVKSKPKSQVLRRARLQVSELCKNGGIQTRTYFRRAITALSQLKLSPLLQIQISHIVNSSEFYTTLLWRSSELLRKALQPAPNWINEAASSKDTISVDDTHILPLLDLNPNDESTIFSLICYVDK